MKKFFLLICLCFHLSLATSAKQELLLDSIVSGAYRPLALSEMRSMKDARFYTSLDEAGRRLLSYSYQSGKQEEILLDLDKVKNTSLKKINGYAISPTETKILVWSESTPIYRHSFTTNYFVYDRNRMTLEPLSETGAQRDARFSPDGRSIAFSRDNNLFIKRLDFGSEIQVTADGAQNGIINGVADWVYEEEFGETCYFDWSSDSKVLAYVKFNEKLVPTYTMSLFGADREQKDAKLYYPGAYSYKYPSAGNANSIATVYAYNLQVRSAKKMTLPISDDDYIPRIRFTKNSNQLAVMTLNRAQNLFRMFYANPKSAQSKLVLTDQNEKYVDPLYDAIQFSSKNFTYVGEKGGYRQLFVYGVNGGLLKQLTTEKADVTAFLGCDTLNNSYFYQSAEDGAVQRSVYRIDKNGKKWKLGLRPGVNNATFNADYSFCIQSWSDINTPPVYTLCDALGKEIRTLEGNKNLKEKLALINHPEKSFFTVPIADGQKLNGWMLKPANFDRTKKYPVLQVQYSGPDSQSALDRFSFDWEYYLAEKGYVVVCVDGRGTGGRGEAFRKSTWCNLGTQESQDQIAVANYLKSQSYVDGSRIGIWGWSFGGYITLMSMMDKTSSFKAGIAIGAVCDWRYYDTVYGERYMRTPAENQSGYDAGSPLLKAADLKGRLLLVHGLVDDNVRSNQTMDMAEAFVQAGVQFDMQLYPTSNHSILGLKYRKHLYRKMADYLFKNL